MAEILEPWWNFLRKDLEHCEHSTIHILLGASKNEYLRILGGEYSTLDLYVRKLITDLRSLDISLVMFIDGAKGILKISCLGLFEPNVRPWTVFLRYNPHVTATMDTIK